ncbi:MAG: hypothetical protein F4Z25_09680 [Chloroflexi bacterium]|nr:hypothetical protein [Chloroflexota bacterium]
MNITTEAFVSLFELEAEQRGMPDLRYIVVPHPIGGIQHDAVAQKARASLPDLLAALTPEPVPIAGGDR